MKQIIPDTTTIIILSILASCPITMGISAYRQGKSVALAAIVGLLIGPVLSALAWDLTENIGMYMFMLSLFVGTASLLYMIVRLLLPRKHPDLKEELEVTLPMPYPPGTRDWVDKQ